MHKIKRNIFYPQEAWETARSFVGGLDLTVRLLKSDDLEVSTTSSLNLFQLSKCLLVGFLESNKREFKLF